MEVIFMRVGDGVEYFPITEIEEGLKEFRAECCIIGGMEPQEHPDWERIKEMLLAKVEKMVVVTENLNSRLTEEMTLNEYMKKGSNDSNGKITYALKHYKIMSEEIKNGIITDEYIGMIPLIDSTSHKLFEIIDQYRTIGISKIVLYHVTEKTPYWEVDTAELMTAEVAGAVARSALMHEPGMIIIENLAGYNLGSNSQHAASFFSCMEIKADNSECNTCTEKEECEEIKFDAEPENHLKDIADEIAGEIRARSVEMITADQVLHVIDELAIPQPMWECANKLGMPIIIFARVVDSLKKLNVVIEEEGKLKALRSWNPIAKEIEIKLHRLSEEKGYCQLRVDEEGLKKRAEKIAYHSKAQRRFVCLGDDDFFSIILASKGVFDEIVVFDIDIRIVEKINLIAGKERLNVTAYIQDFRQPFDKKFLGRFDGCYFDSPYTLNGFKLFTSRAVELLKKTAGKHIFCSFTPQHPVLFTEMDVMQSIAMMRLFMMQKSGEAANEVPESMKQKFGTTKEILAAIDTVELLSEEERWYLTALCRKEEMMHLVTSEHAMPLIKGTYEGIIYHLGDPIRFYIDTEFVKGIKSEIKRQLG